MYIKYVIFDAFGLIGLNRNKASNNVLYIKTYERSRGRKCQLSLCIFIDCYNLEINLEIEKNMTLLSM